MEWPKTTTDTGCGLNVDWIGNGDWLQYNKRQFRLHTAQAVQSTSRFRRRRGSERLVEVHFDSLNNPAIGNTGGWQSWRTVHANMTGETGVHTVFLRFVTGSDQNFVNVNWFTFSPQTPSSLRRD